jgi:hypothetical protein
MTGEARPRIPGLSPPVFCGRHDKEAGSSSVATQKCENGVLSVKGDLVPGRGVLAFISLVSLLSADAKPKDLTGYEGVRIRVKVTKAILSLQVGSSEITNFDYHTSAPITGKRGEFQEVRIPFKDMKRAWSEQIVLNLKSITSVTWFHSAWPRMRSPMKWTKSASVEPPPTASPS